MRRRADQRQYTRNRLDTREPQQFQKLERNQRCQHIQQQIRAARSPPSRESAASHRSAHIRATTARAPRPSPPHPPAASVTTAQSRTTHRSAHRAPGSQTLCSPPASPAARSSTRSALPAAAASCPPCPAHPTESLPSTVPPPPPAAPPDSRLHDEASPSTSLYTRNHIILHAHIASLCAQKKSAQRIPSTRCASCFFANSSGRPLSAARRCHADILTRSHLLHTPGRLNQLQRGHPHDVVPVRRRMKIIPEQEVVRINRRALRAVCDIQKPIVRRMSNDVLQQAVNYRVYESLRACGNSRAVATIRPYPA